MYDYNNIDKSKEEGLTEWWYSDKGTPTPQHQSDRHPHIENRVTQTLKEIWEKVKPTHSTKGTSKYHR